MCVFVLVTLVKQYGIGFGKKELLLLACKPWAKCKSLEVLQACNISISYLYILSTDDCKNFWMHITVLDSEATTGYNDSGDSM